MAVQSNATMMGVAPPASQVGGGPVDVETVARRREPIRPADYLSPRDLQSSTAGLRRVLCIGTCFMRSFLGLFGEGPDGAAVEFVLVNQPQDFPAAPPEAVDVYDCQVIQLPLRAIVHDCMSSHLDYADLAAHEAAFQRARDVLQMLVAGRMRWNVDHGLLTFVMNFMIPQFSPMGRFFPRYDVRNPEYLVQRLNQDLETLVSGYRNAFVIDIDRVACSIGKRYMQDDVFNVFGQNSLFTARREVHGRIEPAGTVGDHYETAPGTEFPRAVVAEIRAMFRTARNIDPIKLVVVDLDDTLWNGVSGDMTDVGPHMIEGMPVAVAEALQWVRRRGIILAVSSKNDEARIRSIWKKIFGARLTLEQFAVVRINWRPKAENMREILAAVNLLPRNVLFIDDNPVERAAMKAAFPEIRMLGQNPFHIRRCLLQSPELQNVGLTDESARRTEMIQAQVERETQRAALTPEQFARDQQTAVSISRIVTDVSPRFPRCLELINKTNQFNTTGRRWTAEACQAFFLQGGVFVTFEVEDRFTPYGLVGVVLLQGGSIEQWVMSCRVIGMQVEQAVMNALIGSGWLAGAGQVTGKLLKTDVNQPCQDLFSKCGFEEVAGEWVLPEDVPVRRPSYVAVEVLGLEKQAVLF